MNWNVEIFPKLSPDFRLLADNLAIQCFLNLFGAILLDGGVFGAIMMIATIAYWVACIAIFVRRFRRFTANDRIVFKYGFPAALGLVIVLQPFVSLLLRH